MIGVLGLGNYSTLYYIKRLNEEYNKIHNGFSTCPFLLYNVDFNLINPYLPNQFDKLIPIIKQKIEKLNDLGVSKILIPNITLHETIDEIDFSSEIVNKIVHPLKSINTKLESLDSKKIIVLGTKYTMESNYISKNISCKVDLLTNIEMIEIDQIRKQVYENLVEEKHINSIKKIIQKYPSSILIIACTELSLLVSKLKQKKNIINLAENQIQKSII